MSRGAPTTPDQVAAAMAEAQATIAALNPAPAAPAAPATPSAGQASDTASWIPPLVVATDPAGIGEWSHAQASSAISTLREHGLDEQDAAHLTDGKSFWVAPQVRERAVTERRRVMNDPEWVSRYLKGGIEEAKLMAAITVRMVAEVREP